MGSFVSFFLPRTTGEWVACAAASVFLVLGLVGDRAKKAAIRRQQEEREAADARVAAAKRAEKMRAEEKRTLEAAEAEATAKAKVEAAEALERARIQRVAATAPNDEAREALLTRVRPWIASAYRRILRLKLEQLHDDHQHVLARIDQRTAKEVPELETTLTAHPLPTEGETTDVTAARAKIEKRLTDAKKYLGYDVEHRDELEAKITAVEAEQAKLEANNVNTDTSAAPLRGADKGDQSEEEIVVTVAARDVCRTLVDLRDLVNRLELKGEARIEVTNMVREGLALLPRLIPAVSAEGLLQGEVAGMLIELGLWYLLPVCLLAPVHREAMWKNYMQWYHAEWHRVRHVNVARAMYDDLDANQSLVELIPFGAQVLLEKYGQTDATNNPLEGARRLRQAWSVEGVGVCACPEEPLKACQIDWELNRARNDLDEVAREASNKASMAGAAADQTSSFSFSISFGPSTDVQAAKKAAYDQFDAEVRTEVARLRAEVEPQLAAAFTELTSALAIDAARSYEVRCAAVEQYRALEERLLGPHTDRPSERTIKAMDFNDHLARITAHREWIARRIAFALALVDKYDAHQAAQQQQQEEAVAPAPAPM